MNGYDQFPADAGFVPKEALIQDATEWQTAVAGAKVRLFRDSVLTLGADTTLADLVGAEATYDGYVALGIAITAFNDPVSLPGNRVAVFGELTQFNYVDDTGHVANDIAGWFLVDSDGNLRGAGMLDEVVTLATNDDGVPVTPVRIFKN